MKALGLIASLITGILAGLLLIGLFAGWYLMRAPMVLLPDVRRRRQRLR
jgi:hypothetical protein